MTEGDLGVVHAAFRALRAGLGPFVVSGLRQHYGERWLNYVNGKRRSDRSPLPGDPLKWPPEEVINIMNSHWSAFEFGKFAPISPDVGNMKTPAYTARGWISELRDYRNKWAHPRDFTLVDTDRFLSTLFLLLTHAGLHRSASEIEELRRKYLSSEYSKELPLLLRSRGYGNADIIRIEQLLRIEVPSVSEIRNIFHQFMKATVRRQDGIRFEGDAENLYELTQFARARRLLTEAERSVFASVYTLLSDSQSLVDASFARNAVLHCIWIILRRYKTGPGGGAIPERFDAAKKLQIVEEFIKGVRKGNFSGQAFNFYFDQELLKLARVRLRYNDFKPFMAAIKNEKIDPEIRANCTGLVISPRCFHTPEIQHRVEAELDQYFRDNVGKIPWQVARGIGLSLANRAQVPYRLLDYIDAIKDDGRLIEDSLARSDRYNMGIEGAKSYYRDRLRNREIPPGACVWEAFYVAHRSEFEERNDDLRILEKRLPEIEESRLREFWERMCLKLTE
jgi:hypothetical protein